MQAECHQPLLQPVVQVAFDPPPGVVDGRHGAGPGGALLYDQGQLHLGPDAQLAEHPPQMRADHRLGQPHAIRHDPAAEPLPGQVSHRPFGISEAQPVTGGQAARVHALPEAVADLPGGALGEREQQRVEVFGGAGQVDHADHLSRSVRDRGGGARHRSKGIGEMFGPGHHGRRLLRYSGADRVGPDQALAVQETGRELDAIEPGKDAGVGRPPVDDLAARVGEQQTHARTFELAGYLVQDRGRGPAQRAVIVEIRPIGHLEAVGTEPGDHAPLP